MNRKRIHLLLHVCLLAAAHGSYSLCAAQAPDPQGGLSSPPSEKVDGDTKPQPPGETVADADTKSSGQDAPGDGNTIGVQFLKHLVSDQKSIWTSPARLRWADGTWLVPLAGVTGGLFATDRSAIKGLSTNPSKLQRYVSVSNYGVYTLVGAGASLYLLGKISHDDHRTETGILAGEAAIDSLAVTTPFKYAFGRERPYQNAQGPFFRGGDSFPSDHAAVAWSIASVIAHEYPGPLTQIFAYGLATAVSASRVMGEQHFPADVLVGAAIGWLVGQHVYRTHHDPNLGGSDWPTFSSYNDAVLGRKPGSQGSPYVPLDSWVYPAFDRLAAMGYIHNEYMGLRPWTRAECAGLVEDVGESFHSLGTDPPEPARLYEALKEEFAVDLSRLSADSTSAVRLESVYTRATDISGPPLNDSYHFGQTIINNFGRPYAKGFNNVSGFSGYASSGRFSVYVRAEYQHAPSTPAYSQSVQDFIAVIDGNPVQMARATPTVNQFTLLDTYALMHVDNWDLSFGKQSLWWGPGVGGALMLSDNAEPFVMLRARRTVAYELPWIFRHLGPLKLDLFMGQLAGNQFPARPLLHGQKVSVKPTQYLELGVSTTSEFGGVGRPITVAAILNSYFSVSSSDSYPANSSPGKRTIGFDFSYQVPHLRNWLTLYDDGLLPEDNPTNLDMSKSPIYIPQRTAMRPGIYLSHVPGVPKLDFRLEAVYTDPPTPRSVIGHYVYWNDFYRDLYTDNKNIIGDWIGREGMGFQGWTTYWFKPRASVQLGYRHAKVAADFIPGGETLNDGSVKVNWQFRDDLSASAAVQYEKWLAPILASTAQANWTSSVDVTFSPRTWSH